MFQNKLILSAYEEEAAVGEAKSGVLLKER